MPIRVAIHEREDEGLDLEVLFEDDAGNVADALEEILPEIDYLGIPFTEWELHKGSEVRVLEDGTLEAIPSGS